MQAGQKMAEKFSECNNLFRFLLMTAFFADPASLAGARESEKGWRKIVSDEKSAGGGGGGGGGGRAITFLLIGYSPRIVEGNTKLSFTNLFN